jgi:uncharacterized repeat protein (TIGR03803 family)
MHHAFVPRFDAERHEGDTTMYRPAMNISHRRNAIALLPTVLLAVSFLPGFVQSARADVELNTLASFAGANGDMPMSPLVKAANGTIYGTTFLGGTDGCGTIYSITPSGTWKTITQFTGANGSYPNGLTVGGDGYLYGTTEAGGANGLGSVFKIDASGTLNTVASFNSATGTTPCAGLVLASDGNFYGTCEYGGSGNYGTVFQLALAPTVALKAITNFTSANGAYPVAALIQGSDNSLYGTTSKGGTSGLGTLFSVTTAGSLNTLIDFNGSNGSAPVSRPIQGTDGNYYGTTQQGGASNFGAVFCYMPTVGAYTLFSFSGSNGSYPSSGLVLGGDGNFYGTTSGGGSSGSGAVYCLAPCGTLTDLINFNTSNGSMPKADLLDGGDGFLYGTTSSGGSGGDGAVFRIPGPVKVNVLAVFSGPNGSAPKAGLIQGSDGNFYGTTYEGGTSPGGDGTVFRMTPSGALTNIYDFMGDDGSAPSATLASDSTGHLFGVTFYGGAANTGTLFEVTPPNTVAHVLDFTGSNGQNPDSPLLFGSDGVFHGTTEHGGSYGYGTLFTLTPQGSLKTQLNFGGNIGEVPCDGLVEGPDSRYYGWTAADTSGNLNPTMYSADSSGSAIAIPTNNAWDDMWPEAAMVLGPDNQFYGAMYYGGNQNWGNVFSVTPSGTMDMLFNFEETSTGFVGGTYPSGTLVLGTDGNFYGTTTAGGLSNEGTVFRMTPSGNLTTLVNFVGQDGWEPTAGLTMGSDGNFYGTTIRGGSTVNGGVVFEIPGPPQAASGAASTTENNATTFSVSCVDPSLTGVDTGQVTFPTPPAHGTVTVAGSAIAGNLVTLQFRYVPGVNYSGSDSFQYVATDEQGLMSNAGTVNIAIAPTLSISSLLPNAAVAGGQQIVLTIDGQGFASGCKAEWNGVALSTTFVSSAQITAIVPTLLIEYAGTASITVVPATGTTSNALTFTITPTPSLTNLYPSWVTAGAVGFKLAATGLYITSDCQLTWNGSALSTTYVDAQHLSALVPTSSIASASTVNITAQAADGAVSNTAIFTILPAPTITGNSPASASAGSSFTLSIQGQNYQSSDTIVFNGVALQTTFVSAAQLTTTVPASLTLTPGTVSIAIETSDGVSSNSVPFAIVSGPIALQSVALLPTKLVGGATSVATVTLNLPAPTGGFKFKFKSSAPTVAAVPSPTITVTAGYAQVQLTIATFPVTAAKTVTITATAKGVVKTAALTVRPLTLSSLTLSPTSVVGGNSSTGTVTLTGAANANTSIILSANSSAASVPASVTVPAGSSTATFPITTKATTTAVVATITATEGATVKTAKLTVNK